MRRVALALLALMWVTVGCEDSASEESATQLDSMGDSALPDGSDGTDDVSSDVLNDIDLADLEPDVDELDMDRNAVGLDLLYCELTEDRLIAAALRAGACLEDASVAGVLNDASRGFVYGDVSLAGYSPVTLGNCDFLVCLANADGCQGAEECNRRRWGESCDDTPFATRCDGNFLELCRRIGEQYRWVKVQDCSRMADGDGECVVDPERTASCQGPVQSECSFFYGRCDGDVLSRCTGQDLAEGLATEVRVDCSELVDAGTCVETAVGGEAPGPACSIADPECTNSFAEGFACDPDSGRIDICVYGEARSIDCEDYGYSGCDEEGQFFGTRCVP